MKYLIYLGHPAHYHLFKNIMIELKRKGYEVKILIRNKDILEQLCKNDSFEYTNILPKSRKKNALSTVYNYFIKYVIISKIIKSFKPTLLLGSEPTLAHLGFVFNIPSIIFSEDDVSIIPQFAAIAYPFVDVILSPKSCNAGKWEYKKIGYDGFHKLAYLQPSTFTPKREEICEIKEDVFFILRFAELNAYHDKGKSGINKEIAKKLVTILKKYGKIYITSERKLEVEFEEFRLAINPLKIHHALAYATMYIGDSQSMSVESALLGTPGIRFNDFAGEIGVLNELEKDYELTNSFKTYEIDSFLKKVEDMLENKYLLKEYKVKQRKMLSEKINVLAFFIWFIENYPLSAKIMKENPNYQYNFS